MIWRYFVLSICLVGSVSKSLSYAQVAEPEDIHSVTELQSRLLSGSDEDRLRLSAKLGLRIPKWTRVGATEDIPCTIFDSVRSENADFSKTLHGVLLDVYSSVCQYTFLAVLERLPNGGWRHVDTVPFWSRDHEPKVSLESLVEEGTKEIVVDGFLTDSGTGIYQTNYAIFKLLQGKLRAVLNEPLRVNYAVAAGEKSKRQSQDSSFRIIPVAGKNGPNTSFQCIFEEEVLKSGAFSMTRRWIYIWIPEMQIFQAVQSEWR
jgi:hypothetical protein